MKILLSIKPEFAAKIFDGTKRFEFRKAKYKDSRVKTVVVYATQPVGRIVGEFDVKEIIQGKPELLWKKTKEYSGISKKFFDLYFVGRSTAYALAVGEVRPYSEPIDPEILVANFTPPQSFMYLNDVQGSDQYSLDFAR